MLPVFGLVLPDQGHGTVHHLQKQQDISAGEEIPPPPPPCRRAQMHLQDYFSQKHTGAVGIIRAPSENEQENLAMPSPPNLHKIQAQFTPGHTLWEQEWEAQG